MLSVHHELVGLMLYTLLFFIYGQKTYAGIHSTFSLTLAFQLISTLVSLLFVIKSGVRASLLVSEAIYLPVSYGIFSYTILPLLRFCFAGATCVGISFPKEYFKFLYTFSRQLLSLVLSRHHAEFGLL